jgi:RNA polymerase sigma factor (TIGR02999 family)
MTETRSAALDRLVPIVYDELRALARSHLRREHPDHSLQATALVHEVYLRLLGGADQPPWNDRHHFFVAAAEAMRRILIEHARARGRQKRGAGRAAIDLESADLATEHDLDTVLALDDAICRLGEQDPRAASVVRLRFFAGLSVEETAEATGLSVRTVKREWAYARAWLFDALRDAPTDGVPR